MAIDPALVDRVVADAPRVQRRGVLCNDIPGFEPAALFAHAELDEATQCWLWTGHIGTDGYGRVTIKRRNLRAHRVAYAISKGQIPAGWVIDHRCREPKCINPDHLDPVTQQVNVARGIGVTAEASRNWLMGLCGNGHNLSEVGVHKQGKAWTCAQCGRDRVARYKQRKLAALAVAKRAVA